MRVLVTGATGFVGGRLVSALVQRGHEVVALVRDAGRWDGPSAVRVVEGDLLDPATLPDAFTVSGKAIDVGETIGGETIDGDETIDGSETIDGATVDAAYYLVHSMGTSGDFERRDRTAAENFRDAAESAGVKRVIYLGGLGEDADDLSPHLRSRREVERVLADAPYSLTTLRAAIIIGAGSASFDLIRQLAGRLPVMLTPLWVDTPCQPIAISDVVTFLVGVLDHPETAGETYEIGGPEVLTYADILRRTRRQLGHRLFIVRVPVLTPRLSAYWLAFVTDVPMSIARPLVEGLRNPVVVDDSRLQDIIGVSLTPFDLAAARAIADEGDG